MTVQVHRRLYAAHVDQAWASESARRGALRTPLIVAGGSSVLISAVYRGDRDDGDESGPVSGSIAVHRVSDHVRGVIVAGR
jgi:hypothetical protein